jgi:predicted dehydrogenase
LTAPTISWIGLGAIALHHLDAFAHAPGLGRPVAGFDVDREARERFARRIATVGSLEELLDRRDADVIVVSTPTPTHHEVCRAVIERGGARRILVEKPMATTLANVRELLRVAGAAGVELACIYHAAHGPEVEWALEHLGESVGEVVRVEAEFRDPPLPASVYGDSWLDSGINALSILARLVRIESGAVRALAASASGFGAAFTGRSRAGEVAIRIRTSWDAAESSKATRLELRSGGAIVLDHQAMAVQYLPEDGETISWVSDSALPRLTQHYVGAFRHALSVPPPESGDLELHRLLLESR